MLTSLLQSVWVALEFLESEKLVCIWSSQLIESRSLEQYTLDTSSVDYFFNLLSCFGGRSQKNLVCIWSSQLIESRSLDQYTLVL